MVKMKSNGGKFDDAFANTGIDQPLGEFIVFTSPSGNGLIIAIDCKNILSPKGHITTSHIECVMLPVVLLALCQKRKPQTIQAVVKSGSEQRESPPMCPEQALGQLFANDNPAACDKTSFPCKMEMVFHKMTVQNDVTVNLNDIRMRNLQKGLVHDLCLAETVVFMPDMKQRHGTPLAECLDQPTCVITRTVVCNDYFVGKHGLMQHTLQTKRKRFRPIVGRYNQGCAKLHTFHFEFLRFVRLISPSSLSQSHSHTRNDARQ